MDYSLIKVLIIDDEPLVRKGLQHIIDWVGLGFCICGEAEDAKNALEKMLKYQPALVLLDIRMPGMYGTDFMNLARKQGYEGEFIVISGYSDFTYAQAALRYGASFYLSKPVDEDELTEAVVTIKKRIEKQLQQKNSLSQYLKKARFTVLLDLFTQNEFDSSTNYMELGLYAPVYQVVIYEAYTPFYPPYNFADLLKVSNTTSDFFEYLVIENRNVILLKGDHALETLQNCLLHYEENPQTGSPLDSVFLVCSEIIPHLSEIKTAYRNCLALLGRRFFCADNQHVLTCDDLPEQYGSLSLNNALSQSYGMQFTDYIKAFNRTLIFQTLTELQEFLFHCTDSVIAIKHFLVEIFLLVKHNMLLNYESVNIPFAHTAAIINLIENKHYLYEIIQYFTEQFEMIMRAIGNHSNASIFDDIIHYINHNYGSPLKLGLIGPLFGYSNAYLGKLFLQKTGKNFNTYLNEIRVRQAARLLTETDLKVYEIAEKVGYKKIDLFHQKFKEYYNISPIEYRKQHHQ